MAKCHYSTVLICFRISNTVHYAFTLCKNCFVIAKNWPFLNTKLLITYKNCAIFFVLDELPIDTGTTDIVWVFFEFDARVYWIEWTNILYSYYIKGLALKILTLTSESINTCTLLYVSANLCRNNDSTQRMLMRNLDINVSIAHRTNTAVIWNALFAQIGRTRIGLHMWHTIEVLKNYYCTVCTVTYVQSVE